jgi:K+ transport systems, NAD-binding component
VAYIDKPLSNIVKKAPNDKAIQILDIFPCKWGKPWCSTVTAETKKLFMKENISQMDAVVTVTNDDETNILVSLLAKNMGVDNTITRISKSSYYPLLSKSALKKWSVPGCRRFPQFCRIYARAI